MSYRIDVKVLVKNIVVTAAISYTTMGVAHSELLIQERNPESSIINQYTNLKNANAGSVQLHQLVAQLNQRVTTNPNDVLAWELLAQIYYDNGYHDYAVYTASEAIDLGTSTAPMKKIILESSAAVSKNQLAANLSMTSKADNEFKEKYRSALSKIYGEVHGFNYDESLPKPIVVPSRNRAVNVRSSRNSSSRAVAAKPTPKPRQSTPPKARAVTKPKPAPVAVKTPVSKPATRKSSSSDPFSILRK